MTVPRIARLVVVVGCLLLLPALAWAQAATGTIAGVVRDTSSAVMPGVTVEAASPALIEKVRVVVTDGQGLYRIVDLRPGTYTVTFTLPGFSTFKRDGIELTTGFTATVNGELKVGALEETVTVSGEAPIVDTQSTHQQTTLSRGTLDALPTTRRAAQVAQLILGANAGSTAFHDVGGVGSDRGEFGVHNQRTADMTYNWGGMDSRQASGGSFPYNVHLFQELVVETAAGTAEATTGGTQINIIPKDGGNRFSGTLSTENTATDLQSNNINDKLRARGLTSAPSLKKYRDYGGGVGGPIKNDRLWFFAASRRLDRSQYVAGIFYNKTPGTVFYEADRSRPAFSHDFSTDVSVRFTWQAAEKHKIALQHSQHPSCQCTFGLFENADPFYSPEVVGEHHYNPQFLSLLTYTYPVTNRFLFEAAVMRQQYHRNQTRQQTATDARTDFNTISVTDTALNLTYGSRVSYLTQPDDRTHERVGVSYVSGTHNIKVGLDLNQFDLGRIGADATPINQLRAYRFTNGVPNQVTIYASPIGTLNTATENSVYAQDSWTIRKLTMNLGLRYAVYDASIPAYHLPAGPFVGARDFPEVKNSPHWKNLSPRLGVAYDLFGNGKTAIKASVGRYSNRNTGTAVDIPASSQSANTARNWNDANRNYVPDCDLLNPASNGECGAWSDLTFGQIRGASTVRADDAKGGYNLQNYNWQGSASVQQELRRGWAVNVGYFRTWYGNFLVTDNLLLTPADYDPFCITVPVDSRLPNSGQQTCGLYDIKPAALGRTSNLITQASHYGKQTEVFNGIDVNLSARFGRGGLFQGGVATGSLVTDDCFVVDSPQQARPGFCHIKQPWAAATQVKFSVVYPLPWDLQASGVFQNTPGFPIAASYVATNAEIKPSLGRDLGSCRGAAVCNGTATVVLIPRNTLYDDRIQQLDVRFTRVFRMANLRGLGNARLRANADVYNIFNGSTILNENTRFAKTNNQWQKATQVMGGRLVKFSAQFEF